MEFKFIERIINEIYKEVKGVAEQYKKMDVKAQKVLNSFAALVIILLFMGVFVGDIGLALNSIVSMIAFFGLFALILLVIKVSLKLFW